MKLWWWVLLLAIVPSEGFQRIALRNQYAQQAEAAYQQQHYQQAAFLYERVRQTEGGTPPPSVYLNLAHSYFHLREYSRASPLYRGLLNTKDFRVLSVVATQLSVIEAEEGNFTKAIALSRQAITADETNEAARFNYELLQKYLLLHPEKRQGPPPPQKRQPAQHGASGGTRQPNPAGASAQGNPNAVAGTGLGNQAPGGGAANPQAGPTGTDQRQPFGNTSGPQQGLSNQGGQTSNATGGNQRSNQAGQENDPLLQTRFERLRKLQLSPEKARQLLDAMRQEEAQYLQQLPRTRAKKQDRNLPDW
ncbi:tetratricopeptide repeat protein [Rufibacter psychrotolerans]|uniref:tetratricopeptide repeat protein n=1 Tax=Rufibacter psychrotolerans TaxID=2812556 RepID=UPI00196808C8|nr:hypothetical protein [Rufibacter sp. SYSU D00308]